MFGSLFSFHAANIYIIYIYSKFKSKKMTLHPSFSAIGKMGIANFIKLSRVK